MTIQPISTVSFAAFGRPARNGSCGQTTTAKNSGIPPQRLPATKSSLSVPYSLESLSLKELREMAAEIGLPLKRRVGSSKPENRRRLARAIHKYYSHGLG